MKPLSHFLLLLLVIASCEKDTGKCGNTWEADPVGQWYVGDLHVHATGASNDTGGDSYPEDVKRVAIERGLDFVVLTDHSNSTGSDATTTDEDSLLFNQGPEFPYWDSAAFYTDANFLMIDGNEISPVNLDNNIPTGHIGCVPMDLSAFNKEYVFTDRPKGTVNGANAMSQATAAGCFKILNHPYALIKWIAYDWTSYDYDAMEIWNGTIGFDPYGDEDAYQAWICDLLAGKQVTPIGSSDCHRVNTAPPGTGLNPALGYPSTAVFAQSLLWNNIMQGLKNGDVAIFEGESRLFINDYTENKCHANGNNISWLRLRGKADSKLQNAVLKLHLYTSCNDTRPSTDTYPVAADTVLHEAAITPGESFDIAVKVSAGAGVYNATLKGSGFHYFAISKAIVVK
ncbi:MAG: CehA/McbA family metallohydrolase [Chitinophagales bacterium]|nr:CehA/McbA family metallohydrolase [Chitinophagales bacterium]